MITQTSCSPFNDSFLLQEHFHGVTGLEAFLILKKVLMRFLERI